MTDQKTDPRLSLLNTDFADRIRKVRSEIILRLFACECALLALTHSRSKDPRLWRAVKISQAYAKSMISDEELNMAYAHAEEAAKVADEIAFDTYDAVEEGRLPANKYSEAFAAARASFSAKDCCLPSAVAAANNAVYEAWAALSTVAESGDTLGGLISPGIPDEAIDSAILNVLRRVLEDLLGDS